MSDMFEALKAPFPPERIHWRVGSTNKDKTRGLALAYLDARDVMERLDTVCGPDGWQSRYPHANGKTVCEIGIRVLRDITQSPPLCEWVWKADGAGDTDFEAEKGALSDAFKRAAVRWGIGRYLYDIEAVWVEIRPAGKSYAIAEGELTKLGRLLGRDKPRIIAATPSNTDLDSPAVADELVRQIKATKSPSEYQALIKSEAFSKQYQALPNNLFDKVTEAGKAHYTHLRNPVMAG